MDLGVLFSLVQDDTKKENQTGNHFRLVVAIPEPSQARLHSVQKPRWFFLSSGRYNCSHRPPGGPTKPFPSIRKAPTAS